MPYLRVQARCQVQTACRPCHVLRADRPHGNVTVRKSALSVGPISDHVASSQDKYKALVEAPVQEKLALKRLQAEALETNAEEDHIEMKKPPRRLRHKQGAHASFAKDGLYEKPSDFIRHLLEELPPAERLTRRQTLFMVKFAEACDAAWEDESKPPEQRRVHHMLLLGAGGTGKTHVVQNLVFKAVEYIWPHVSADSPSMLIVASSNAQAKNISTAAWKGRTLHNAACMRVQHMINPKMRPGDKAATLERLWCNARVLIIEEVSMVSAANYNMLDFRAMYARTKTHAVTESNYSRPGCSFGRCPIVIHLGDFLQLSPTAALSLVTDVNAKDGDGAYIFDEPPDLEIQNAIRVFGRIPCVIELQGTKRFVPGDPLIKLLDCMRRGTRIPNPVWKAFEKTFASDSFPGKVPKLDSRHNERRFLDGYGMCMYWETLARWITKRARRDARVLGVPLVFMQAADECQTLDRDAYARLLNVPNIYNTGRIHGVLPAHVGTFFFPRWSGASLATTRPSLPPPRQPTKIASRPLSLLALPSLPLIHICGSNKRNPLGMRVRFTGKFNAAYGLVQEQRATIVDFVFHEEDAARYRQTGPGELFRPRRMPTGLWLQVDDFVDSPSWDSLREVVPQEKIARGLYCMPLMARPCCEPTHHWDTTKRLCRAWGN